MVASHFQSWISADFRPGVGTGTHLSCHNRRTLPAAAAGSGTWTSETFSACCCCGSDKSGLLVHAWTQFLRPVPWDDATRRNKFTATGANAGLEAGRGTVDWRRKSRGHTEQNKTRGAALDRNHRHLLFWFCCLVFFCRLFCWSSSLLGIDSWEWDFDVFLRECLFNT